MDRLAKLVTAALLLGAGAAHAGYAQLAAPAGFGGSPGTWTFAPSANDLRYGSTAYSPNALRVPVPGTSATMPAAYRFAANAPRIAAAAIFMNPYVRAGVGIASWLGLAGFFWDEGEKLWKKTILVDETIPIPLTYYIADGRSGFFLTKEEACADGARWLNQINAGNSNVSSSTVKSCGPDTVVLTNLQRGNNAQGEVWTPYNYEYPLRTTSGRCPQGWTQTPAGCVGKLSKVLPVPKEDFERDLPALPMPDPVPWELPKPTPLPVEQPVINPEPGSNPLPRPLFVPTGDPVPNPQYDPNAAPGPENQPYIQPGVRVNPSPTPTEPWRVDVQPVNRPQADKAPLPNPLPEDPANPDKPKPQEQQGLCDQYPDILACQKLDQPDDKDLPTSNKDISITPDGGWGSDNAACPAPKQITVQGRVIPIPFDLFCTWVNGMRPIIIAMAWLSAAFILLGARNES